MMLLVPAPMENRNAVSGAIRVICLGRFSMTLAATATIQSTPPAACIMAAVVTTARMMAMAAAGGSPGASPKTNTRTKVPRPPHRPTPTPPARVPMTMAPRTTSASRTKLTLMSFPSSLRLPGLLLRDVALGVGDGLHDGPGLGDFRPWRPPTAGVTTPRPRSSCVDRCLTDRVDVGPERRDRGVETPLRDRLELVELGLDLLGGRAHLLSRGGQRVLLLQLVGCRHQVGVLGAEVPIRGVAAGANNGIAARATPMDTSFRRSGAELRRLVTLTSVLPLRIGRVRTASVLPTSGACACGRRRPRRNRPEFLGQPGDDPSLPPSRHRRG